MLQTLVDLLIRRATRAPYSHLTGYMNRYWLRQPRAGRKLAVRLHETLRSDHERALHDHPWSNASFVLRGGYWEIIPGDYQSAVEGGTLGSLESDWRLAQIHDVIRNRSGCDVPRSVRLMYAEAGVLWRGPGAFVRRRASALHRLVIPVGTTSWSIFAVGVKRREWGFLTSAGWVHNLAYNDEIGEQRSNAVAVSYSAAEAMA